LTLGLVQRNSRKAAARTITDHGDPLRVETKV
jgi:hypothetical protein